jgi:hypothetical protein
MVPEKIQIRRIFDLKLTTVKNLHYDLVKAFKEEKPAQQ